MKRRKTDNDRNITESKKYRCECTCCHRNDLPWYHCVIFVKHDYNLNIPAVANQNDIEKLDRTNSHVTHVIKN